MKALVPRLRFPEFCGALPWRANTLAELCGRITNGSANAQDHEEGGLYPLFDRSEIVKRSNHFIFDAEVVILPGEGMRLVPRYFSGKFNLHQRAYALMEHHGSARFVYYALDRYNATLLRNAVKSTVPSLRLPIIEQFVVPTPDRGEQQKIADCLSSLDNLITAHADKLAALKQHKQGLLEQLFPCEGETVPRLRFPEFRNAGAWQVTQLSNQMELISGQHLAPDAYDPTGELPYFTGPSDYSNRLDDVTKWTARSKNTALRGDTLVTVKGSGVGELLQLELAEVAMGRQLMAVRPHAMGSRNFLFQFLATRQARLHALAAGNLIPGLSRGDLLTLAIKVPSTAEQAKVGSCLSTLDTLITAQSDRLAALKRHKQGLLQQLFPVMDDAAA